MNSKNDSKLHSPNLEALVETSNIVARIKHQLDTKPANTILINGAPGTGKSFLLDKLSEELSTELPKVKVLGPYKETTTNPISCQFVTDLFDQGYLSEMPGQSVTDDLNSTWFWLKDKLYSSVRQSFIILVDFDQISWNDYNSLRVVFSSLRYLEYCWDSRQITFVFVVAGFWDHPGLEAYYESVQLSFPYTVGNNYLNWGGISCEDFELYSQDIEHSLFQKDGFFNVLYEIAGGNPKIIIEISRNIDPKELTIKNLLKATNNTATKGSLCDSLLSHWKELPTDSIEILNKVLILRQVPIKSTNSSVERLLLMGIVKVNSSNQIRCIEVKSWFVEVLLRTFAEELQLSKSVSQNSNIQELMPTLTVLHQRAYKLLQEIEILLRNFIVTQLWSYKLGDTPILSGWSPKIPFVHYNEFSEKNVKEDAQERAVNWRSRCQKKGLPVDLNPDIAYLSLPDLADILSELSMKRGTQKWEHVTSALNEIVSIRDAVMHNQLIEINDFDRILKLKNKINTAISDEYDVFSM